MVAGAPVEIDAVGYMLRDLNIGIDDLFVAHNARFDRGFLKRIDGDVERALKHICTMKCAKVIWPDAPGYSNQFLRYWLGLEPQLPQGLMPHRAAYDIAVTATIFAEELKHKPLEELLEISNKPILLKKMPMGKHKGMPFDQVPISYLKWILDQQPSDMDPDLVYTAQFYYSKTRSFR
jgi:exodeoxyribonuclease X